MLFFPGNRAAIALPHPYKVKCVFARGEGGMSSSTGQEERQMIDFSVFVDCSGKFPSGNGDLLSGSSLF